MSLRLLSCALSLVAATAVAADRPNVVLIVADDFGYGDLGVHGCKDIPTPHLDALAAGGVRCTNGYVSAPQCSPTRAGLMTGRYQQRFGHEYNSVIPNSDLPKSQVTLAERLKAAGYVTGMVGKWHLGSDEGYHPLDRGFGEFFGFVGGANPYLPQGPKKVVPRILRGREPADEREYLTDAFGREAVAFIDRHKAEPFFLYLPFNSPHGPLEATPERLEKFKEIADETRRTYAGMVSAMDDAVGTVLQKLKDDGLEENTLVTFISDNGGPTDVNASSNAPFRGVKGETLEGGIRSPFFVKWPAKIEAGTTYDHAVIQLDLYPTILDAVGATPHVDEALDGVSLLPHFAGDASRPPHETLYWRFNFPSRQPDRHKWAIRRGDWKLVTDVPANRQNNERKQRRRNPEAATAAPVEEQERRSAERLTPQVESEYVKLFNLAADPGETKDLTAEHPEVAAELKKAWQEWNAGLAEPGVVPN